MQLSTDGFRCHVVPDRERVIVRPVGELDIATVGDVEAPLAELEDAGFAEVLLDLRETTFLDSTGVHLLVRHAHAARENGHRFGIVAQDGPVLRVLELTGLLREIPLVDPPAV
jgi:anti-sigma B factor antagonist